VANVRWKPGEEIATGKKTIVWAESTDGRCPAKQFFDELDEREQAKLENLFEMMAEQGTVRNHEKFKLLEDGLFEFKAHQLRMPCFFDSRNRVVVTHGFRKKRDDAPKAEIERARQIRDSYDA
jgi:hypothetical protein